MPQFNAEHVPPVPRSRVSVLKKDGWARYQRICDFETFVIGYFEAFEWLLPTDDSSAGDFIDRGQVLGWGADAKKRIRRDCRDFWRANQKALKQYTEVTDRHYDSAGIDFYLTREGHGAGFWDRGHHQVLTDLSEAARAAGEAGDVFLDRGWLRFT